MSSARRALVLVVLAVVITSACQQWPTMRGAPGNTGFNSAETELSIEDAGAVPTRFTADLGTIQDGFQSPVISGSRLFAPTSAGLGAFDLNGEVGCSGSPRSCVPVWTGDVGGGEIATAAAVSGWTVFVTAVFERDARLFAFDLRGQTGCSGTPVVCQPLWTAANTWVSSPTFFGSSVFVIGDREIAAYDVNGVEGCAGIPKVCVPTWTTSYLDVASATTATIGGGRLFVSTFGDGIQAFDAAGVDGCSGVPKECSPLWVGPVQGEPHFWPTSPVVMGDRVYVALDEVDEDWFPIAPLRTIVVGYPLDGGDDCSGAPGTPRVCAPVWSASIEGSIVANEVAAAYDVLYLQTTADATPSASHLVAIDTTDPACVPGPCGSAWSAPIGNDAGLVSPIVANGTVYVDRVGSIQALDARGAGCSGTPVTCTSTTFVSYPDPGATGSALANGALAVITRTAADRFTLRVFG